MDVIARQKAKVTTILGKVDECIMEIIAISINGTPTLSEMSTLVIKYKAFVEYISIYILTYINTHYHEIVSHNTLVLRDKHR